MCERNKCFFVIAELYTFSFSHFLHFTSTHLLDIADGVCKKKILLTFTKNAVTSIFSFHISLQRFTSASKCQAFRLDVLSFYSSYIGQRWADQLNFIFVFHSDQINFLNGFIWSISLMHMLYEPLCSIGTAIAIWNLFAFMFLFFFSSLDEFGSNTFFVFFILRHPFINNIQLLNLIAI